LLREAESESACAEAFTEWDQSPDKPLWDSASVTGSAMRRGDVYLVRPRPSSFAGST
jgi:hypothetical protein